MSDIGSHGKSIRSLSNDTLDTLSGHGDPGKFGRMFPGLSPLIVADDSLFEVAQAMVDDPAQSNAGDNPQIPAGYTYFGQFVDHDITLDTTPLSQQLSDPTATENFRTPSLDLDSLYADGPSLSPHIYDRNAVPPYGPSNQFLIGKTSPSPSDNIPNALPNDLPRNRAGRALIGDERNDENLAVAQTHLAFLKFHNAVVEYVSQNQPMLEGVDQFNEARRIVTWHYQWIVLFDWVERLTERGLVRRIKHEGRRFYRFKTKPYMPAEFSAAAYRIGHSMVRETYDFNRVFREGGLTPATLDFLFGFTGKSGAILGDLANDPDVQAHPRVPGGKLERLPGNWIIDWRRFFELDQNTQPNATRLLDPQLAPMLRQLPGEQNREAVLAFRNLRRGVQIGLPSGQDVALAMGIEPLAPADVAAGAAGDAAEAHGLHRKTPLWFYILKEAEVLHAGRRLGPVGATIVAETFLGLVHGDQRSFLWQRSNWRPELPSEVPGHFTMADMLRFIGDVNPIGNA
ncbi:heme peroxidase family protein [Labrenzia sp. OB1]|uniref:peroxidase family protein n=1 Tax=Labrenzia sp. OB1 TaxID=1561204 RepID=UPI0007B2CDFA|nr:heme peroxidase family protein [Labrenzia sp. OB1]KZM52012.1 heme peroxidase [Labrenzia sp. OB1]